MTVSTKPNLIENLATEEKKKQYTAYIFDKIYHRYDFITVFLSYGMDKGWKRKLIKMMNLRGDEKVLDLACGTGDITFAAAAELPSGHAIGLDITHGMLKIAEEKRQATNIANVSYNRADIMQMPYPDNTFDIVTGGYALRNVPNLKGGIDENLRYAEGSCATLPFADASFDVAVSFAGIAFQRLRDIPISIRIAMKQDSGQ